MRAVVLVAVSVLACTAALAQTPPGAVTDKPAAAKPKPPAKPVAPASVRDTYAAMPETDRKAIQADLIWSGDYNGVVSGEFNDRSIAAVKSFQRNNKTKDTGILNSQERAVLAALARTRQADAGWRIVEDKPTGARLGIPTRITPQSAPGKSGTRWSSAQGQVQIETFQIKAPDTTLPAVFEQQKQSPVDRKVTYSLLRPDFFVVTGLQGLKKFYVRAQLKDGEVRGVSILHDQAMDGIMEPVVIAMSNAFAPFASATSVVAVPTPRRRVEYGTGIVMSATGDILTERQLTDDCQVIVVAGQGHAERVANDGGLALLRLYGSHDLAPAALTDATPTSDLLLVGIADPQSQAGGSAVTQMSARTTPTTGTAQTIQPPPALGFSGAPALDAQGRFLGIVGVDTAAGTTATPQQAAVIPARTVRAFLAANNVGTTTGRAGLDATKASVVRVICVRK